MTINVSYTVPRDNMTISEICGEIVAQISEGVEVAPVFSIIYGNLINEAGIRIEYPGQAAVISDVVIT